MSVHKGRDVYSLSNSIFITAVQVCTKATSDQQDRVKKIDRVTIKKCSMQKRISSGQPMFSN